MSRSENAKMINGTELGDALSVYDAARLIGCAVPVWTASYTAALGHFVVLGLALALVGASLSVGTPYVGSREFFGTFFG